MIASRLRRIRYELRSMVAGSPRIYLPLAKMKHAQHTDQFGPMPVAPDTDLVIEAFPRSGNTFATYAFLGGQHGPVKLAHHLHAPAQLIAAARWRRPAVLIVREPIDAVCSFVQREPQIRIRQALRNWIRFHSQLLAWADAFEVATFDQVTGDFGRIVERVNARFGTHFVPFVHSAENVANCFRAIEQRNADRFGGGVIVESGVARPSTARSLQKNAILQELRAPSLAQRLARANAVYQQFADMAVRQAVEFAGSDRRVGDG